MYTVCGRNHVQAGRWYMKIGFITVRWTRSKIRILTGKKRSITANEEVRNEADKKSKPVMRRGIPALQCCDKTLTMFQKLKRARVYKWCL